MRVFVARTFGRWASQEGISDRTLLRAASEMIEGRYEADLGGLLFKKRIARTGSGKSGGFRTIIGFRKGMSDRIVFLFGFAKSDRETITEAERLVLAALARSFVDCDEAGLSALLASRTYDEVEAIQ